MSTVMTLQPTIVRQRSTMVNDGIQIRRQGPQDFMAYYQFTCINQDTLPLSSVTLNLDKGLLDFNGDRLKLIDWPPVLSSISINKHLHQIAISSNYQASSGPGDADRKHSKSTLRRKIPAIRSKDMTFKLCTVLRECLSISPNLKTLHLKGLPLRERDLISLTKGLAQSTALENLSLANCPISDEGLEVICQSVKYSTSIRTVDFTGCSLTWRGAEHMANIIKHQGMQRHGTAWAESLRYRQPQFEGMGGLRRVTLNANTLIGDRGAAALAHELAEDLWVKAVDLQKCGLSNRGARCLLEALKTNSSLCVLDTRNNPLVDRSLVKTIIERVLMNPDGQSAEYCWIKPPSAEPPKASCPRRRALPSTIRAKVVFRKATHKGSHPGGQGAGVTQTQKSCPRAPHVPWRSAARAGRERGLPPGVTISDQNFPSSTTVRVTAESKSEDDDEEEEVVVKVEPRPSSLNLQDRLSGRQLEVMQVKLKECRLRLAEERTARLKAESRLMEFESENARLRDSNHMLTETLASTGSMSTPAAVSALEDEVILESIESSFTKFHAFLDLLKDAGLGQLASMAGIDRSDFQPLGRPQLSSTIGAYSDGAALPTGRGYRDSRSKTQDVHMGPSVLPAFSDKHGGAITPVRSTSPAEASLRNDRLLDATYTQASESAAVPGAGDIAEPDQYSKPDSSHDSGSEHNVHNQMSFGKTFQTGPSHIKSSSDSQRSDGSYKSSFDSVHSHGEDSRSSASGSDIISDEAESVDSAGSRSSQKKGERVSASLSGSEGSPSKTKPGRGTLEQMESLQRPFSQSDNDSF